MKNSIEKKSISDKPIISRCDIVICVHNALSDLRQCLESVFRNTPAPFHLIIINDGSDAQTSSYLRELAGIQNEIELIEHIRPEGYTKSANQGLKTSRTEFVVLMNSDVIVPEFWLNRLMKPMLKENKIGLAGPVSNAASWQSVPERFDSNGEWKINALPEGMDVNDYDKKIQRISLKRYPEVPLLNGFCTLIRKEVLEKTGYLDEESFPVGYGEENDLCFRASAAGYKLIVNDSVYVFHAKSKSFGKAKRCELAEAGSKALEAKHGKSKINKAVRLLNENTYLAELRKAILNSSPNLQEEADDNKLKILFLLPIAGLAGGIHSIVQEANGMRELGIDARIATWDHFRQTYFTIYSELNNKEDLFCFFNEFEELLEYASGMDAVIATIHSSVILLKEICHRNPAVLPAYYIQDYEPLFFEKHSEDWKIAVESYTFVPGALLFAKTKWLQDITSELHNINVEKVSPSLDSELYYPLFLSNEDKSCIVISAMVRPSTPRRGAERTMRVLKRIKEKHGDRVRIKIFGSQTELLQFYNLETDFDFQNLSLLNRTQTASLFRETDIFIDLSVYQAFGRTGLEAMACGCAVILPQKGGTDEYAEHLQNSLLIDTSDDDECCNAIDILIDDAELIEKIRFNAVKKAAEYSIRKAAISEILLIRKALKQKEKVKNVPMQPGSDFSSYLKNDKRIRYDIASIIVCLYNGCIFDENYMSRLEKSIRIQDDILLLDYGVKDEERTKFENYIKEKKIYNLISVSNLTYSEGINPAIDRSDKPYFALINYGIEFSQDWLVNLLYHFADPLVGAVSPIISENNLNGRTQKLFRSGQQNFEIINQELKSKFKNQNKNVKMIGLDCAVLRRVFIDRIGGFYAGPKNVSELDISLSLRSLGIKTVLSQDTYVEYNLQKYNGTPAFSEDEEFRNYIYSLKKQNNDIPSSEELWGKTFCFVDGADFNTKLKFSEFRSRYVRPKRIINKQSGDLTSIILITYNQLQYTQKCIESVTEHTPENYELIIVDNASDATTIKYLERLRRQNEKVSVLFNQDNLGFPAAVNQGIRSAKGKYILLLNNDTIVTDGWLDGLIKKSCSEPPIGLVGPVSNQVSGIQKIETTYNSETEMHEFARKRKSEVTNTITVFPRIAFLCTLIKNEVIDAIGGLDERFSPGNYEDDDFCLRAQAAGFKTIVANDVFIHHFGSKSFTADGIEKYQERLLINKKIFIEKWGSAPEDIWLKGASIKNRIIKYPIKGSKFKIYYDRAIIYLEEKEYSLAQECLISAIESYAEDQFETQDIALDSLYNLSGNLALLMNDYTGSKKYFEKALNLNPESSAACTGLAELFLIDRNYEASKTMLEWGLKLDPMNSNARKKLDFLNSEDVNEI